VPKKADLVALLRERGRRIDREAGQRIAREVERLLLKKQRILQLLPAFVRLRSERLARAAAELARLSPVQQVARREEALRERARRLTAAATARLARSRTNLAGRRAAERLERALAKRFEIALSTLEHSRQQLIAFSPESVLARGYSITQDAETGAVLRSSSATAVKRKVRIRLASGRLGARVEEVEQ
jgi:exodeoxyribonuclease VII large subunit